MITGFQITSLQLYIICIIVQWLICVWLFAIPWTAALQALLFSTISWSLLKFVSIESVRQFNHLVLCSPFFSCPLPSISPRIRAFSNESVLPIRWPKDWSFGFSISPSNEYSGLISFRIDQFDIFSVQRTLKSLLQHHNSNTSILRHSTFFYGPTFTSVHDYWKNHVEMHK